MTVQQTKSRSPTYVGDALETDFPTDFEFLETDDVRVFVNGIESSAFSVSGGAGEEGTVTMDAAPADGVLIDILRDTARTQTLYSAAFATPTILEKTFDRVTRILQSLDRYISQCVRTPIYEAANFVLPKASSRASKFLAFDENGDVTTATVGNAQTVPPQFIQIDKNKTDYLLTLPGEISSVTAADVWVDVQGANLHANPSRLDYEIVDGTTIRLLSSLDDIDGAWMQVRIVSFVAVLGTLADGSITSPAKFANRPVDFTTMATGTPGNVIGYDGNGNPADTPSPVTKYVGETWTWPGSLMTIPQGNIACLGQSLSTTFFSDLFAVFGYTHGGSGGSFNLPNPQGRTRIIAGQGNTAEGGGLGTNYVLGDTGGGEELTMTEAHLVPHTHGMNSISTGSSGAGRVGSGGSSVQTASTGGGAPMDIMNPYIVMEYACVYTGRTDHDYQGMVI